MNPLKNELYTRIQTDVSVFEFIQNVALDGFWYINAAALDQPWISQRFWVTLGYNSEGPWPSWQTLFDTTHLEQLHSLLAEWSASPTGEPSPPLQTSLACFHKTGKRLWLECRGQYLPATDSQPARLMLAYTDITTLKEKEQLLTRCNTEAKIGYWEVDFIENQVLWSEMTKRIHEVPLDYQPQLQAALDFYDPEYQPLITEKVERATQAGEPYAVDLLLVTALGQKKWTRAIGVPEIRDGVCQRLYGTFQDIDAAKRDQLAREESERKFKGIFDSTFTFIGFLNPEGILLDANQTALSMAGLRAEDVVGKPFWDCYWWQISAAAQQKLKQKISLAAQGQEITYEVEVWVAHQRPITILFSLRPVFNADGQVIFIIPEGRPIQEMVEARRRYKSVLDATQVGTWEWNVQTNTVHFNERWANMIGYTLDELTPLTLEIWENSLHSEDLALIDEKLKACFSRQTERYEIDFRMRHKAGHWVWIQATGKVLSWTSEGQPLMMYGIHQEINTRKKDEAEIYRLLNLSQMQNERLNNFAHIVSHNLRSHTFSIQGVLEVLLLDHPELSENTLIHMLNKASENLTATIADLSEMVTSDLLAPESKVYLDLHAMVRKNIESTATLAKKAQVQLMNKVPKASKVKAIPAYLDSLTLNFMTNAIKYCAPDRERVLEISLDSVEGFDRIAFTDNGLGIDLEKYGHKLFDMYQTFHTHADSRGIGLYITHNQVKAMGGRIEVTSELNKGTTFWVLLPQ